MFMVWCFYSHLVLRCTNRHQNKPIFSCFRLRGGAFSRILYFGAQAGTKNKLIFSCLCLWGGALVYISNARLQFFIPILPQRKIVSAVSKHHNSNAASMSAAKITLGYQRNNVPAD